MFRSMALDVGVGKPFPDSGTDATSPDAERKTETSYDEAEPEDSADKGSVRMVA